MSSPEAAEASMGGASLIVRRSLLPYYEFNASQDATVVLLHGAMSSPHEYRLVIPHLTSYHILVPFLPGHGSHACKTGSSLADIHSHLTLSGAATAVSKLIAEVAHHTRAHIVGVSLGAHLGVLLAARYPETVSTLFVSGYMTFPPRAWHWALPYAMLTSDYIEGALPDRFSRWLLEADLKNDEAVSNLQLAKEVCAAIVSGEALKNLEAVQNIPIRSLVFAALKRGAVPTDDSLSDAITLGKHLQLGNLTSKVAFSKMMRHYWQLQDPCLFAMTVRAWIEGLRPPEQVELVERDERDETGDTSETRDTNET